MSEEWKELDLGNIPNDFFVNERYEIKAKRINTLGYGPSKIRSFDEKMMFIEELQNKVWSYQFRLKPLESIRIPRENIQEIEYGIRGDIISLTIYPQNRKIEIIEE